MRIPGPVTQRQGLETGTVQKQAPDGWHKALHGSPGPLRNRLGLSPRPARLGSTQGLARPTLTAHLIRLHSRSRLTQRRLILRTIGL